MEGSTTCNPFIQHLQAGFAYPPPVVVRRHQSADLASVYVFVGEHTASSMPDVVRKALTTSVTAKSSEPVLATHFGPDVARRLVTQLQVAAPGKKGAPLTIVPHALYPDDTVQAAHHTIRHALAADVYAWVSRSLIPRDATESTTYDALRESIRREIIRDVFRGRATALKSDIRRAWSCAEMGFSVPRSGDDDELVTPYQAIRQSVLPSAYVEPMWARYEVDGAYAMHYEVDPFRAVDSTRGRVDTGTHRWASELGRRLLWEVLWPSESAVLEIATWVDVKNAWHVRHPGSDEWMRYFPSSHERMIRHVSDDASELDALFQKEREEMRVAFAALRDAGRRSDFTRIVACGYARVTLRAMPLDVRALYRDGGNTGIPVDLHRVFTEFVPDSHVPVVGLDTTTEAGVYKVDSAAVLRGEIDAPAISMWATSHRNLRRGVQDSIKGMLLLPGGQRNASARVALSSKGVLDVTWNAPRHALGTDADVETLTTRADEACVERLNASLGLDGLTLASLRTIAATERLRTSAGGLPSTPPRNAVVTQRCTYVFELAATAGRSPPSLAHIAAVMDSVFGAFVCAPHLDGASTLVVRCRRTKGFGHPSHWMALMSFASRSKHMSDTSVATNVARWFRTSRRDAAKQIERYASRGVGAASSELIVAQGAMRRYDMTVPTLTLVRPDDRSHGPTAFRATVTSISDAGTLFRIVAIVASAVSLAHTHAAVSFVPTRRSVGRRDATTSIDDDEGYGDRILDDDLEDLLNDVEDAVRGDESHAVARRSEVAMPWLKASVLDSLYSADAALFNANQGASSRNVATRHRYATVCGSNNRRQPVVITTEELARLDAERPGSYGESAIKGYGSTPELARRNAYICPQVWCPKSRVSMTLQQYRDADSKCPDPSETAMEFDSSYWNGETRHPGFLDSRHHPLGLCMPCCFRVKAKRFAQCDVSSRSSTRRETTDTSTTIDGDTTKPHDRDFRYIRGQTVPLPQGKLGMPPRIVSTLLSRISSASKCGPRPDGSGPLRAGNECVVRVGISRTPQQFLYGLTVALNKHDSAAAQQQKQQLRVSDVVSRLVDVCTPDIFVSLRQGGVCRAFMSEGAAGVGKDADIGTPTTPDEYDRWTTRTAEGRAHAARWAGIIDEAVDATEADALRVRERLVHAARHRFKTYLQDDGIIKTHHYLLSLVRHAFQSNVVVLEVAIPDSDGREASEVVLDCDVHDNVSSMRLSDAFVFLVKQGPFYEPVFRSSLQGSNGIVLHEIVPLGGRRELIDALIDKCRKSSKPGGDITGLISASVVVRVLSHVLHVNVKSQVVDASFNVIGLVTHDDVYVPLPVPEEVLVGPSAPPRMSVVSHISKLRPRGGVAKTRALFERLAVITGHDAFRVASVSSRFMRLVSGDIVPLGPGSSDVAQRREYLQNLNILVGKRYPDEREVRVSEWRELSQRVDHLKKTCVDAFLDDPTALRELYFLRSAFNPLSSRDKHVVLRGIVKRMLQRNVEPGTLDRVTLALLHGPDPLGVVSTTSRRPGASSSSSSVSSFERRAGTIFITEDDLTDIERLRKKLENVSVINDAHPVSKPSSEDERTSAIVMLSPTESTKTVRDGVSTSRKGRHTDVVTVIKALRAELCRRDALTKPSNVGSTTTYMNYKTMRWSRTRRRNRTHDDRVLCDCDVWRVFHAIMRIHAIPSVGIVPLASTPLIVLDYLSGILHTRPALAAALLQTHPSLRGTAAKHDPTRVESAAHGVLRAPWSLLNASYVPGMLDVVALSAFADIGVVVARRNDDGGVDVVCRVTPSDNKKTDPGLVFFVEFRENTTTTFDVMLMSSTQDKITIEGLRSLLVGSSVVVAFLKKKHDWMTLPPRHVALSSIGEKRLVVTRYAL